MCIVAGESWPRSWGQIRRLSHRSDGVEGPLRLLCRQHKYWVEGVSSRRLTCLVCTESTDEELAGEEKCEDKCARLQVTFAFKDVNKGFAAICCQSSIQGWGAIGCGCSIGLAREHSLHLVGLRCCLIIHPLLPSVACLPLSPSIHLHPSGYCPSTSLIQALLSHLPAFFSLHSNHSRDILACKPHLSILPYAEQTPPRECRPAN